jgi:predicted amidohydrolase
MEGENIKVAAFQFSGSGFIENNYHALERGIKEAARQNVRLLITQECALCGYPPIEVDSVNSINFNIINELCYEVRFPEYFRELFKEDVLMAFVSFCDVGDEKQFTHKYEIIKSHLITRAVENAMYIMSVNSISNDQLAPTCLIDPDGLMLQSAPKNEEYLISFVLEKGKSNFGRDGRIKHSKELLKLGI